MANDRKPDKEGDGWVTSPVFAYYTAGAGSRQRKVSVFDRNLGSVKEIKEHDKGDNEAMYEEVTEQKNCYEEISCLFFGDKAIVSCSWERVNRQSHRH